MPKNWLNDYIDIIKKSEYKSESENTTISNTESIIPDDDASVEDLVKYIKAKREKTRLARDFSSFSILPLAMKISAKTIGLDLVTVKPLSVPIIGNIFFGESEEEKMLKFLAKRKEKIDKLLK